MKIIQVKPVMDEEKAKSYLGKLLGDKDYNILVNYDCDVYCEETGILLAKFRKKVLPKELIVSSYSSFQKAAKITENRNYSSAGKSTFTVKQDGTLSKTGRAKPVYSGIIGYFDRTMRAPYCRLTSYTAQKVNDWNKCVPVIKFVSGLFEELIPDKWQHQKDYCDRTSQDFIIKDSVFTTITVNKNWQTAVHTDKGDLEGSFGNLVVLRKGLYTGGYFVILRWGVAFDLQNGDVLFTDVHQYHANTPIKKLTDNAERISLVMYYRENMIVCGSAKEEIEKAKSRKNLKNLNDKDE